MNPAFARNAIIVMWMGALGITTYKEFGNPNNPSRPLPRPCKFIPPAIGYSGLGLMAEFLPQVAFAVALGLTAAEVLLTTAHNTIFDQLASSITKESALVAAAE